MESMGITINPLVPKDKETQCDAEKTNCYLTSSAKNIQINWRPFKYWIFCRVHLVLHSGTKQLKRCDVCSLVCRHDMSDNIRV